MNGARSLGSQPDADSAEWIEALTAGGSTREHALVRLHDLLLRVALAESRRRDTARTIAGPELDDLAQQAADDAMIAVLDKLATFRGESRFTTWAYRFVVLEVSSKLGRHYWRDPTHRLDGEQWERLPDRFGVDPDRQSERREFVNAVRRAVDETLTEHQRAMFVAVVVDAVPLDAVVAELGVTRGAVYKSISDARRKIRAYLVTNGHLDLAPGAGRDLGTELS